jgi:hypothetical protein
MITPMDLGRVGFLALTAAVVAGCASRPQTRSLEERQAEMMRPYEALEAQKAMLWQEGYRPQTFAFENQGTVTVHRWALTGWPGETYINVRFTYENTTDRPVEHAFVWIEVLDGDEQVAGSAGIRLINPIGYALWPANTVTAEIRVPTHNAHLDKRGWHWGVACESLADTLPTALPVLPDETVRDRGVWRHIASTPTAYSAPSYRVACQPVHVPGEYR